MSRKVFSFRHIAIMVLTMTVLILGGLNMDQKRRFVAPDDGVSWIQGPSGVQATYVLKDSSAERAGIRRGDILKAIDGERIINDRHVTRILYTKIGLYGKPTYSIVRNGSEPFDITFVIVEPPLRVRQQRLYLEVIGLLYFLVGLFVLLKRSRAPLALHFYFVCMTSFVYYVFQYTGKLNTFDWTIFWFDLGATVLLPPLFLHFCLEFPTEPKWLQQRRRLLPLIYVPGALLFVAWLAFDTGVLGLAPSPLVLRNFLWNLNDFHFGLYFLISAGILINTYRTVTAPELRQQMKWVTRGTALAVVPYFVMQSLPRLFGNVPGGGVEDFAIFLLVLIPISFGYAILRYRLMDVDIIFKWGVTYTLSGAAIVGLYVTFVVFVGELLGSGFDGSVRLIATIVAALLFAPIKDQFQVWLDKFFYRDRYNVRQTLIDFGRTLGSEVHLEHMLDRIVDRLGRALLVRRTAIFLENPADPSRFIPARANGVTLRADADFSFLSSGSNRTYIFFEHEVSDLNYFIPCHVKDRVIAYIGLGRTENGDYLTSEDIELLETVSDYIGIALENARLYRSLEHRASEYQSLKDYSENIVESISVGVVVEDVDGRIVGWNRALEHLTGQSRYETIGKLTVEIIPTSFLQRLAENSHLYKQQWNGLTVNFSATSLLDKSGATRGTLIIIDNITDRVRLEDQLVQNEKLTSIGLLAAGVAHEVNTPLAVISSYSQMLRKEISPEDSRYKLLEKITRQTFRASEIVNNLLNFSRTNATEFAEVDVHQVITETLSLLEHQFRQAQIQVASDLVAEHPVIIGNSGKLQQVFLNLFLNAKDAMPGGGELRIQTESVDSKLEISVQDSGIGISRENIKKIYDPFFTTKAVGKGTGLGLSVSYGIVQEHGGNISVESKPGRGSAFRLELPLVRKTVHV